MSLVNTIVAGSFSRFCAVFCRHQPGIWLEPQIENVLLVCKRPLVGFLLLWCSVTPASESSVNPGSLGGTVERFNYHV